MVTGVSIPDTSKMSQEGHLENSMASESFLLFDEESTKEREPKAISKLWGYFFDTEESEEVNERSSLVETVTEIEGEMVTTMMPPTNLRRKRHLFESSTEIEEEMLTTIMP